MFVPLHLEDIIPKLRDDLALQDLVVKFLYGLTKDQQKLMMNLVDYLAFTLPPESYAENHQEEL